ncbi:MAG: LacI family transcriptional regulator [Brevinematales bacterium]|nr:LacI family transcriptional regulator [Brevinematales bacterium]
MRKHKITRKDVAEKAGVSPSTVSRALNDHPSIPKSTAERIKKIAKDLNYIPSHLARSFYQKKSYRIGIVIPYYVTKDKIETVHSEYFSQMLFGCIISASKENYTISVISDNGMNEKELARTVLSHTVDGLIFLGTKYKDQRFYYLLEENIPFILVYNYLPDKNSLFIDIDSMSGMKEAFNYLSYIGIKKLAYIGGNKEYINAIDRENAYLSLVKEFNMTNLKIVEGNFSKESGFEAAKEIAINPLPEAVLCANDLTAYGLIKGLEKLNIKVPDDIRVIGFDNQEISLISSPTITTIDNPFYRVGYLAAKNLIHFLNNKEVISQKLESKLVIRESA